MHVIRVRNVAEALPVGVMYLLMHGKLEESRAGKVLVVNHPVTTIYDCPTERVLFSPARDANPFFHLFESLWMFAGRRDGAFLNTFIKDFSSRFAEPDGRIHDAYGYRWREHFSFIDQLHMIVRILHEDPTSRQAVLTMWDPVIDLGVPNLKTRPCNTNAFFRIQEDKLEMTVCCRSNDILYGAYGANAVHFSMLQEYLAAAIGVAVGRYYQISNNFHAYMDVLDQYRADMTDNRYPMAGTQPLINDPKTFLYEVEALLTGALPVFNNRFLAETAWPMLHNFKARQWQHNVAAADWRAAGREWLARRRK